jgi:hypothetical protein
MNHNHERVIAHGNLLDLRTSLKNRKRLITDSVPIGERGSQFGRLYDSLTVEEKDFLQAAIEFTKPRPPTWLDRLKEKLNW